MPTAPTLRDDGCHGTRGGEFTPWGTKQKVLGLVFDIRADTVAMPPEKTAKAQTLIAHAFNSRDLS